WGAEFQAALGGFVGPLGEFYFRHFHGFHPMNFLCLDRSSEWIFVAVDFLQRSVDLFECGLIEPSSGLADMNELFLFVVEAEDQRPEILARAFGINVAADNAIHCLSDLDFQPLRTALLFVATVALLGENALQALLLCDRKQSSSLLAGIMLGVANDAARSEDIFQHSLAIFESNPAEIVPVEVDKIEHVVKDRQVA